MIAKKLREALEEAAGIMAAAGAKAQSKALQRFVEVFKGQDDKPVSQLMADLRRRLHEEPAVDLYIERLVRAGVDKEAFDSVLAEISKDRGIRKEQANAIARKYTEGSATWPTKARAVKEIKASFAERALDAVKMRQVDKASRF
jgi:hypothetical protein